jgi:hypothetical protein
MVDIDHGYGKFFSIPASSGKLFPQSFHPGTPIIQPGQIIKKKIVSHFLEGGDEFQTGLAQSKIIEEKMIAST